MSLPQHTIKAIRYLCSWRVNSTLARVSHQFTVDLSYILACLIADKLSTRLSKPWKKNIEKFLLERKQQRITESIWPLNIAFVPYPSKTTFGENELIFFELKLFGADAEHEIFLELILPAMEALSFTKDRRWCKPNQLWGNFDIYGIYVCHGRRWQPLVDNGRLDLGYTPTPWQWYEIDQHQDKTTLSQDNYKTLIWLSSFDLTPTHVDNYMDIENGWGRSLLRVIEAMENRINTLLQASKKVNITIWDFLSSAEERQLNKSLELSATIMHGYHDLEPVQQNMQGKWQGVQRFPQTIPTLFLPYLDIASVLHIGRQTEFGCGSFLIQTSAQA